MWIQDAVDGTAIYHRKVEDGSKFDTAHVYTISSRAYFEIIPHSGVFIRDGSFQHIHSELELAGGGGSAVLDKQRVLKIPGNVILVRDGCHYWHYHLEVLGQLFLLKLTGAFDRYPFDDVTIAIVGECSYSKEEVREYFGFHYDKLAATILQLVPSQMYQVEGELVSCAHASATFLPMFLVVPIINNVVARKTKFASTRQAFPSRVYVGRQPSQSRGMLNVGDLLPILQAHSVTVVFSEDMTWEDQRYLFSQAELIISPEGTGFSMNAIFANSKAILIELFRIPAHTSTGYLVSTILGARDEDRYFPIACSTVVYPNGTYLVNVTKVDLALKLALRQ
jgi:hypothetical protein